MSAPAGAPASLRYLIGSETAVDAPGRGEVFDLGPFAGKQCLLVLRITEVIEQEALDVAVWGSVDGKDWGAQPLLAYPQKFYRGVTPAAVDLRQRPEVKFLQAHWDVNRWGRGYPRPYFKIALEIQELES